MNRRRRGLLLGTAAAVLTSACLPAPAIAQGVKELKLVTGWAPKKMTGLQHSAERLAQSITTLSEGRLVVKVYPAETLVHAFEVFDAVGAGVADMYHASDYYFGSKSPALYFFCAVPYGMTADEVTSWIHFGGGQALWDEVGAQFNIKPLMALNTGVQMGGWFTKEINHPEDFKGLRYRMPELGAEVLRRMRATVVTTPGSDIVGALKSGAIDASEWVGPWMDMELGLDKALWEELAPADRALIEAAAHAEVTRSLARFNAQNAKALKALRADERIQIRRFNDGLIKTFGRLSKEVLADTAARDSLTRKVYDSYMAFLAGVMDWGELSETGYRDTRRLALGSG